ncbi:hypothetical protein I3760_05G248300 [Carya illinoinensis]|uniref:Uncharacterized protein n=1 Tax=Carya illinoinensis TaxID=32201 RepID=A0A922F7H2_CARIL|nr:hypothetical protein I3760_05G248300 [Carya illinoinensis]KAG6715331.1 hypothetical protein I3842_05G245500 [Carya illinoinensis]KAG6715335.1 hypothetical protein I3842_05G245900 [Carya illinoinensis]KAG6715343.1 hypothetical protein I3842_05G246700 [Carya illinoinensis]
MGGEAHVLKRIPRIRFPQRHPKSIASDSTSQAQSRDAHNITISKSDVPAAPTNTAVGGKASLQPKRTPVSDKEIEAILLGGCF